MSIDSIGESLANFQAALTEDGSSFSGFAREHYVNKWCGETIYQVMAIRTSFVSAMLQYLIDQGLLNLERVSLSPVTDPLAHDIEHVPTIGYKGHPYKTTHSMIYSKFLACFNPRLKGIFVDSPNIRLELESPDGRQRSKYLIDFSQLDVELRRDRFVNLEEYYHQKPMVTELLQADLDKALAFFEGMIIAGCQAVVAKNGDSLKALGVTLEVPTSPFPRIRRDEAIKKTGTHAFEKPIGETVAGQFFWIVGLMRENYDLIYPYLNEDGSKRPIADFASAEIYNYDLCAKSKLLDGSSGPAWEVLSGAIREWLYEPIVERLLDNRILKIRPEMKDGEILNLEELDGYGPFLTAVAMLDAAGKPLFPSTFGGGLGLERCLYALLRGPKIQKVDDVTLFGKNPDSHPLYLY
ncbi:MAG: hypothetical protein WC789_02830 [Lentisphaeria bacterium]|jgi:aspartyl/asparaginyl-tRNA synthetase